MSKSDAMQPGVVVGRLTLLHELERKRNAEGHLLPRKWACRCACGTECIRDHTRLAYGLVGSCGCLRSEVTKERIHGPNAFDGSRVSRLVEWGRYGHLLTICAIPSSLPPSQQYWLCLCKCGQITKIRADYIAANPTVDERKSYSEARRAGERPTKRKCQADCGCRWIAHETNEFRRAERKFEATQKRAASHAARSSALIEQYGLNLPELEELYRTTKRD